MNIESTDNPFCIEDEKTAWDNVGLGLPTWWSIERETWEATDIYFPSLGTVRVGTSNTHAGALLVIEFDKLRDDYDPAHEYYTAEPHWGQSPFSDEPTFTNEAECPF